MSKTIQVKAGMRKGKMVKAHTRTTKGGGMNGGAEFSAKSPIKTPGGGNHDKLVKDHKHLNTLYELGDVSEKDYQKQHKKFTKDFKAAGGTRASYEKASNSPKTMNNYSTMTYAKVLSKRYKKK